MNRNEKAAHLRKLLAPYRGGRFETSTSGGASGMVFFRDAEGREFYIGGFQREHAEALCTALTLTLELLESKS